MVAKLKRRDRPSKEAIELRREELHIFDTAIKKAERLEVGCWPD